MQKSFLPIKSPLKSKVNWLFVIMGLLEAPQVKQVLGDINPIVTPILATVGVIFRTFYTDTILKTKY